MALKLIFMGTPEFALPIMKAINQSPHDIAAVYTQAPKRSKRGQKINFSPVHLYSEELNLDVRYPENLNNDKEIQFFKRIKPDVVIVVAYGKILPKKILDLKNIKFLNVHASLLPKWRGAAPIQRSIINMDKETGISIMKILPKLDSGPVMLQDKLKITNDDDFISLSKKLSILGSKLLLDSLNLIEKKSHKFIDQDEHSATYAKKIDKKEAIADWNMTAEQMIAKIKGLNPSPGVWFMHKSARIKIIRALETNHKGRPGEVLDDELTIACKENSIKISLLQKEGKKKLTSKDFLIGYKIKKGEKLS
tara:strand:- start:1506 stop:2426 length:921 start_codon:yes stop_codon:yes gene_type:complete